MFGLLNGVANPLELVARVKTQLRRYTTYNVAAESRKQIYDFAGLYICRDNRKCSLYGRELALTPLEFDILWYLCEHKGTVVSSEVLFEAVWGEKYLGLRLGSPIFSRRRAM